MDQTQRDALRAELGALNQRRMRSELQKLENKRAKSIERVAPIPDPIMPTMTLGEQSDDVISGFVRGLRDIPDAGAQMLTRGIEAAIPDRFTALDQWAKGEVERVEDINRAAQRDYAMEQRRGRDLGLDPGRIAGNVTAVLPLAVGGGATTLPGQMAGGAASGGLAAMLMPEYGDTNNFWEDKAKTAAMGAGAGAAGSALVQGVSRAIRGAVDPAKRALRARGVPMTPGQIIGGTAKEYEERLRSLPVFGDAIAAAQRRGQSAFNVAVADEVLRPIGKSVGPRAAAGRELMQTVDNIISDEYEKLLPNINIKVDRQFGDDVSVLRDLAADYTDDLAKQFDTVLRNHVLKHFTEGQMGGPVWKRVQSDLKRISRSSKRSDKIDTQQLGYLADELEKSLAGLLERSSDPGTRQSIARINEAFARKLALERAAAGTGGEVGSFTPRQYRAAVKAMGDNTRRKSQFAQGRALGQELADAGVENLAQSIPDSGTAPRLLTGLATLGGAAAVDPTLLASIAAASGMYSRPGQYVLSQLLMGGRGPATNAAANAVQRFGPLASVAAGQAATRE